MQFIEVSQDELFRQLGASQYQLTMFQRYAQNLQEQLAAVTAERDAAQRALELLQQPSLLPQE